MRCDCLLLFQSGIYNSISFDMMRRRDGDLVQCDIKGVH